MSDIDRIVGTRLRQRREAMGWSIALFSERLGIEASELVAIEAGTERLGPDLMIKACRFLDVRPQYFFSNIKPEPFDTSTRRDDDGDASCCVIVPFRRN
jgi:transcriptional regulator with XRE-family HTH domain